MATWGRRSDVSGKRTDLFFDEGDGRTFMKSALLASASIGNLNSNSRLALLVSVPILFTVDASHDKTIILVVSKASMVRSFWMILKGQCSY
jgi:hypothetical protein